MSEQKNNYPFHAWVPRPLGIMILLLIVRKVHFRWLFSLAFLLMAASNAYLYFQYQTEGMFHNLWLPMLLNFTGLLILYSLVAAWGMKGLPSRYLATFVFLMIWMRNAIAPVVGTSIYSNALYHRQQYRSTAPHRQSHSRTDSITRRQGLSNSKNKHY